MKFAVVGAGISGLSAAWLLAGRHDVTVFEREARLGGHSHTVDVDDDGRTIPIDTGFIVFNPRCYPNLVAFFQALGVATADTSMSFAVSCAGGRYEYSGSGLNGYFGQRSNLASLPHWMMVAEIFRFFREARQLIESGGDDALSLGDWLQSRGYGDRFVRRHILPMGAAIWSTPAEDMLDFPAVSFARFFANHNLLQASGQPVWRTVLGGSRTYVARIADRLAGEIVTGDGVVDIARRSDGVTITTASGRQQQFDACLIAGHADEALRTLTDADDREAALLGSFRYARNDTYLHTDPRFMPRRRRVWSSWNYLSGGEGDKLSVTYWMNRLQPLPTTNNYFVTLNPHVPIASSRVIRKLVYHHPIFDSRALAAQRDLWQLQGRRRTWFAGSYFGHGFHEDGLQSGLAAAEAMGGVRRPWSVADESGRIHLPSEARSLHPAAIAMAMQ